MKTLLRKLWKRILSNLLLTVYLVSSFLVLGISIWSQWQTEAVVKASERNFCDEMLANAKRLVPLATLEELNSYRVPADAQRPEWKALRQKLIEFADDAGVTFAYYLRVEGDKVQYIVDNDLNEQTRSGIDTKPEELSTFLELGPVLAGKPLVSPLGEYAQDWPGLISAYVPIFDSDGSVAAICGVDKKDTDLLYMHNIERGLIIFKFIAFVTVALSGIYCIGNMDRVIEIKTQEVVGLKNAMVYGMANMVERRDTVTGNHIERTQHYLRALIGGLNKVGLYQDELKEWDIEVMVESSQLHDMGKIAIPDSILNKQGSFNQQEFETMKKHVEEGVRIVNMMESKAYDARFLKCAKIIIETHHEKWDGSGYPKGLVGRDVPLPGRLMAIADTYDALTSVRPYKDAISPEDAARIIHEGSGSHFDPVLVYAFEQVADQFASIASQLKNQAIA